MLLLTIYATMQVLTQSRFFKGCQWALETRKIRRRTNFQAGQFGLHFFVYDAPCGKRPDLCASFSWNFLGIRAGHGSLK